MIIVWNFNRQHIFVLVLRARTIGSVVYWLPMVSITSNKGPLLTLILLSAANWTCLFTLFTNYICFIHIWSKLETSWVKPSLPYRFKGHVSPVTLFFLYSSIIIITTITVLLYNQPTMKRRARTLAISPTYRILRGKHILIFFSLWKYLIINVIAGSYDWKYLVYRAYALST